MKKFPMASNAGPSRRTTRFASTAAVHAAGEKHSSRVRTLGNIQAAKAAAGHLQEENEVVNSSPPPLFSEDVSSPAGNAGVKIALASSTVPQPSD